MALDRKAIRTPSFRAKLSQLKGVSADEKALFQRVGNLIDTLIFTQRQGANPRERRRIVSSNVPVPQNVQLNTITGGINVTWDPVDIPELGFYEVQVSETTTFATGESFVVLGTSFSFRGVPDNGLLFFRLRSVLKGGATSEWAQTLASTDTRSVVFSADQDYIEPENRTTVEPKPTLLGAPLAADLGSKAFVGIGAYIGPSPLTFSDTYFDGNTDLRNEVNYDLYEENTPFPSTEQRRAPTVGEYIDADPFYTFSDSFYMRFGMLPGSITDFFNVASLTLTPSTFDVEFLRYRILNSFYSPGFAQAGYTLLASLGTVRF